MPGRAPEHHGVATVESLDREGRGVAHADGKAVFIEGALPGERVRYGVDKAKPTYELAHAEDILEPSAERATPLCGHYAICGGCTMQHIQPKAQVAAKQRVLEDALWHIGRLRAESMLSPIHGPNWTYRRRARLTSRWVQKKGAVLVGF